MLKHLPNLYFCSHLEKSVLPGFQFAQLQYQVYIKCSVVLVLNLPNDKRLNWVKLNQGHIITIISNNMLIMILLLHVPQHKHKGPPTKCS